MEAQLPLVRNAAIETAAMIKIPVTVCSTALSTL
jgi:hypothetical protein